tara:strand:+ start:61 stop:663 length:603 start_codon:yes stop_codon:yes gene_type:complete
MTIEYDFSYEAEPKVVVLSGPSGVGKDAVLDMLKNFGTTWHFVVTATTRLQRPGEKNGVDYIFLDEAEFHEMVGRGDFLEYAQVYGNWYGVPVKQVSDALESGLDVFIKTDVQGAETIKKLMPQAIFIFLMPPSLEELERRLRERKTDTAQDIERRIRAAVGENEYLPMFNYVVVNGDLETAVQQIYAIVIAEKCRVDLE